MRRESHPRLTGLRPTHHCISEMVREATAFWSPLRYFSPPNRRSPTPPSRIRWVGVYVANAQWAPGAAGATLPFRFSRRPSYRAIVFLPETAGVRCVLRDSAPYCNQLHPLCPTIPLPLCISLLPSFACLLASCGATPGQLVPGPHPSTGQYDLPACVTTCTSACTTVQTRWKIPPPPKGNTPPQTGRNGGWVGYHTRQRKNPRHLPFGVNPPPFGVQTPPHP